jgi:hypothetical protein
VRELEVQAVHSTHRATSFPAPSTPTSLTRSTATRAAAGEVRPPVMEARRRWSGSTITVPPAEGDSRYSTISAGTISGGKTSKRSNCCLVSSSVARCSSSSISVGSLMCSTVSTHGKAVR